MTAPNQPNPEIQALVDQFYDRLIEIGDLHQWQADFLHDKKKYAQSKEEWHKARHAYRTAEAIVRASHGVQRAELNSTMVTVARHSGNGGRVARFRRWLGVK